MNKSSSSTEKISWVLTACMILSFHVAAAFSQKPDAPKLLAKYEEAEKLFREATEHESVLTEDSLRIAIEKYRQATALYVDAQSIQYQIVTLTRIGVIHGSLDEYQKALECFTLAREINKTRSDRWSDAIILQNIGAVHQSLGDQRVALEYFTRALSIWKDLGAKSLEADVLSSIGSVHDDLGEKKTAIRFYNWSLSVLKAIGFDRFTEGAKTFHNLATCLKEIDARGSLQHFKTALEIWRELRDIRGEAATLNALGSVHHALGEKTKALENFNSSLILRRTIGDKSGEAATSHNLMFFWNTSSSRSIAIFYGKQAVKNFEHIRANIQHLDRSVRQTYLRSIDFTYRALADVLIADGRLIEAQYILDLLKQQEYAKAIATRDDKTPNTIPYSDSEADIAAKVENLVVFGRALAELRKEQKELGDKFPADKLKRLEQLNVDIKIGNAEFDKALAALGKADASVEARTLEIKSEKNLQSALLNLGRELNTGAVALYTVIGTEEAEPKNGQGARVPAESIAPLGGTSRKDAGTPQKTKFGWVILVTPKERKAYPINVENLERNVFQFREALSSDKYDPQPLAKKIYDAIFRQTSAKQKTTLEADLREVFSKHENKTVMWSLDGVLRYIPMAALHDGDTYLVEEYRHVTFTKESLLWLMNQPKAGAEALGLGVSAGNAALQMSSLPGVDKELSDIIKQSSENTGILTGTRKINAGFNKQELLNLKDEDNKFQTVHIASHYSFNPTDQNASFLLVGDGKLTFGEMKNENNLFGTVDLLTLSACDTGVSGNGKEAEGFAYLAQSLGAKSVIASLWKVSDAGTPELMIRFYKLRAANPQMSKGEAFRQAQLEMMGIDPKTKPAEPKAPKVGRGAKLFGGGAEINLALYNPDGKSKYSHPHYWAPFVLIGNWR